MSLILDALNRSRQEREAVPGLGSQHSAAVAAPARWRRMLPWVAFCLAGLLVAWLLLERSGARLTGVDSSRVDSSVVDDLQADSSGMDSSGMDISDVDSSSAEMSGEAAPLRDAPIQVVAPATVKPAMAQTPPANASAVAPEIAALYAQKSPPAKKAQASQPVAQQPEAQTPAAQPARQQISADTIDEQPIDVEAVLRKARDETANARLVDHPVPFLSALSQQEKDAIPTVMYQRHDYLARSPSVVLNGKTLRVGGSPGSGVKVREILPDSVILEHGGVKFRLRALNSWVNL